MNKITVDNKIFVELSQVKKILKHGLKPQFSKEDSKEFRQDAEELYEELIKDIEVLLK